MNKILFVCHGNICRSVMAEMIMRHLVALDIRLSNLDSILIDSCATSREEIGNDIYPPAKRCLSAHGIPFTRHAARQIAREDYETFDAILCMEDYNIRNLRRRKPGLLIHYFVLQKRNHSAPAAKIKQTDFKKCKKDRESILKQARLSS